MSVSQRYAPSSNNCLLWQKSSLKLQQEPGLKLQQVRAFSIIDQKKNKSSEIHSFGFETAFGDAVLVFMGLTEGNCHICTFCPYSQPRTIADC